MIKSFSSESGYGFIECEDTYKEHRKDVFVHKKELGDFTKGMQVTFICELNKDGKPQARDIRSFDGARPGPAPDDRDGVDRRAGGEGKDHRDGKGDKGSKGGKGKDGKSKGKGKDGKDGKGKGGKGKDSKGKDGKGKDSKGKGKGKDGKHKGFGKGKMDSKGGAVVPPRNVAPPPMAVVPPRIVVPGLPPVPGLDCSVDNGGSTGQDVAWNQGQTDGGDGPWEADGGVWEEGHSETGEAGWDGSDYVQGGSE